MAGDVIIQMLTHVRAEGQVIQPVTHTQKKNLGKIYERRYQIISISKKYVLVVRPLENTRSSRKALLAGKGSVHVSLVSSSISLFFLFLHSVLLRFSPVSH